MACTSPRTNWICWDLLTVLGNLARIVYTVLSAANTSGASLLQNLSAVTGSMLAFLRSAEGTTALQQIFGGLGAVAAALLPLLAAIGRVVASDIAPAIAQLGPMVAAALGLLVQAAAQALASLLVPALGAVSGIVTELAPAVSTLVGELVGGALADSLRVLAPALIELARAAAPRGREIQRLEKILEDAASNCPQWPLTR